mmetsp:Transcript_21500/g.32882  ORF Transcript_21500/g.32882 Transcript_21500/m.32882 type:complete len:302 (-) Transcript_21500:16-921(-)
MGSQENQKMGDNPLLTRNQLEIQASPEDSEQQETTDEDEDKFGGSIKFLQHVASLTAHGLALMSVCVVTYWISLPAVGGGGLSWSKGDAKRVFNWHPLMMVTAYAFMTVASLSFRTWDNIPRSNRKAFHAIAWTVAFMCGLIGLVAVFKSHNDGASGYIANMYSLHSWIGSLVAALFILQFASAHMAIGFFPRFMSSLRLKTQILAVHQYLGPVIYVTTGATIMLGIQEKEGFIGTCAYQVDDADLMPIRHFFEISLECRVSHILGLIVFLEVLLGTFCLYEFPETKSRQTQRLRDHGHVL